MALEWGRDEIRVQLGGPRSDHHARLPDSPIWQEAIDRSPMPIKRRGKVTT